MPTDVAIDVPVRASGTPATAGGGCCTALLGLTAGSVVDVEVVEGAVVEVVLVEVVEVVDVLVTTSP
jgi:hypothetical protein